jgi:hypothetical protein
MRQDEEKLKKKFKTEALRSLFLLYLFPIPHSALWCHDVCHLSCQGCIIVDQLVDNYAPLHHVPSCHDAKCEIDQDKR